MNNVIYSFPAVNIKYCIAIVTLTFKYGLTLPSHLSLSSTISYFHYLPFYYSLLQYLVIFLNCLLAYCKIPDNELLLN